MFPLPIHNKLKNNELLETSLSGQRGGVAASFWANNKRKQASLSILLSGIGPLKLCPIMAAIGSTGRVG